MNGYYGYTPIHENLYISGIGMKELTPLEFQK